MDPVLLVVLSAVSLWLLVRRPKGDAGAKADAVESKAPPAKAAAPGPIAKPGVKTAAALAPIPAHEPIGWIAALVSHGGAVLAKTIEHMQGRRHLMPFLAASWEHPNGDSWNVSISDQIDLDYTRSTLWNNAAPYVACPVFPGCGVVWFLPPGQQAEYGDGMAPWPKEWLDDRVNYSGAQYASEWEMMLHDGIPADQAGATPWNPRSPFRIESASWPPLWRMQDDGRVQRFVPVEGWSDVRPAASLSAWAAYMLTKKRGQGRGYESTMAHALIGAQASGTLVVPPYWRAHRDEWYARLVRWYYRAQWFVWAADQYLVDSGDVEPAPAWWRDHCAAWGIGAPASAARLPELRTTDTRDAALALCSVVATHTPVPGSRGSLGDQIAPSSSDGAGRAIFARTVFDMPESVGSLDPPYYNDWWALYAIRNWHGKSESRSGFAMAVIQMEAAFCGGGIASAVTAPIGALAAQAFNTAIGNVVAKIANVAVQNVLKLAEGNVPEGKQLVGDVVGLVGSAVDAIGPELGGISKNLPPELWTAVRTVGAEFPDVDGADMDGLRLALADIRSRFDSLEASGWRWIEAGYGGLGLSTDAWQLAGQKARLF
jgi:hypothetical protein